VVLQEISVTHSKWLMLGTAIEEMQFLYSSSAATEKQ
jgi:hypothetical protein